MQNETELYCGDLHLGYNIGGVIDLVSLRL